MHAERNTNYNYTIQMKIETTVTRVSRLKRSSLFVHSGGSNKILTDSLNGCGPILFLIGCIELILVPPFCYKFRYFV